MRNQALCFALVLTLPLSSLAQSGSGGGKNVGRAGAIIPRTPTTMDPSTANIFISGTVVLEDGGALTAAATIQTICKGQKRTETHSDSRGSFSFRFEARSFIGASAGLPDAESSWGDTVSRRTSQRDWRDCELQASLPGFSSEVIQLDSRVTGSENANIGRLVLHRLDRVDGFTISATSAGAPDSAKRAFEKGREEAKKNQWAEAQQWLEKAVQIYPKYAVAWYELGRVQLARNDAQAASDSFGKAIAADPQYANAYHGLAQVAAHAQKWAELADLTSKLLALDPVSFPDAWFFNAVGTYFQNDLEAAEKSARQGLKLDPEHRIPKLEYVLGLILSQKHDYPQAVEHMRQYLHLVTKASDVEEGQKQLAEIEKLSATASVQAVSEQK